MEVDSGQRVIVAYGEGDFTDKAQFILANNYPDQNLSEEGLHWQWQTDLILGDDAALLQLFENDIKRDELRYGSDFGKLAENDSTQDSVYVLKREGYEKGQNTSDYPEYAKQAKDWEQQGDIALIKGDYVLRELHLKRYELKDHLGNVRVIVADVKDATLGLQGQPREFAAILKHYSNYYPFGMEKPSMVYDKGGYRYGFNGQEQVNEMAGAANHNTALFWEFDIRTARRWNLDPVKKSNASLYVVFSNNPIIYIDPNGDTDYYNMEGKKIGTNGIANGEKMMVIKTETAAGLENNTLNIAHLNAKELMPIFPKLVKTMENQYDKSNKSFKEEGFIITKTNEVDNETKVAKTNYACVDVPSGKTNKIDLITSAKTLQSQGFILVTDGHVHNSEVTYYKSEDKFESTVLTPSQQDKDNYNNIKTTELGYCAPLIVFGFDDAVTKNEFGADPRALEAEKYPGQAIRYSSPENTRRITFYTGDGSNGTTMKFKDFSKACDKILKNK